MKKALCEERKKDRYIGLDCEHLETKTLGKCSVGHWPDSSIQTKQFAIDKFVKKKQCSVGELSVKRGFDWQFTH